MMKELNKDVRQGRALGGFEQMFIEAGAFKGEENHDQTTHEVE